MAINPRHLRSTSLREQALAEIRAQLVRGALKPGQVYSAAALAVELGVSNGPVREAMLELVSQGLMEPVRNRGYRVVSLSERDRQNIAELRLLIEIPSMARLAGSPALHARSEEFKGLVADLLAEARANDMNAYLEVDRAFHLGLLSLLENDRLTDLIGSLRDQTRQFGIHTLAELGELMSSALRARRNSRRTARGRRRRGRTPHAGTPAPPPPRRLELPDLAATVPGPGEAAGDKH